MSDHIYNMFAVTNIHAMDSIRDIKAILLCLLEVEAAAKAVHVTRYSPYSATTEEYTKLSMAIEQLDKTRASILEALK